MKILEDANFQKYLEDNEWTVECESPLEVRHSEGSFATNYAAQVLLAELHTQYKDENNIISDSDENTQLTTFKKLEKIVNIMDNYIEAAKQVESDNPPNESDENNLSGAAYDAWKKTYHLVFSDEVSVKIRTYLGELGGELNYYSDYGYNDDVLAFYNTVKSEMDSLTKLFRPTSSKMKM